MTTSVISLSWH